MYERNMAVHKPASARTLLPSSTTTHTVGIMSALQMPGYNKKRKTWASAIQHNTELGCIVLCTLHNLCIGEVLSTILQNENNQSRVGDSLGNCSEFPLFLGKQE